MTSPDGAAGSFNEVVALAGKAARGAGLGWGHADDIGQAARWLAEYGVAWDEALCRLLEGADPGAQASRMVRIADWAAQARPGALHGVEAADVLWVVPMASAAIFGRTTGLVLTGAGGTVHLFPDGAMCSDRRLTDVAAAVEPFTFAVTVDLPRPEDAAVRRTRPAPLSPAALARLSALANLTLVPASDLSRTKGAGAEQPDND